MTKKTHGTSEKPVQTELRWGMDFDTADRICNFNRHYAEYKGYATNFLNWMQRTQPAEPIRFYDSVTGNLLFTAPVGRTIDEFCEESHAHGWPSFRDAEARTPISSMMA